ncbi:hypothetical protein ABPG74_020280 [Tetrahymena malaccensis]
MIQISNLFRKIDMNSQPFSFFVEKEEKKKKTELGGVFSIFTIITSAVYLSYLLYLFFGNQIIPKITSDLQNKTSQLNQTFSRSAFGITYIAQGLTPDQLEQQTGKVFLTFQIQKQIFVQGNYQFISLSFVDCENDPNFIGYKCIDFSNQPESVKELFTDPTNLNQSYYSLVVQPCQGLSNCANDQDIEDYIMQANFVFFIKIRVNQFDQQTQQIEESFLIDYFNFDQNISIFHQYLLQQQVTTLTQGYFIQGSKTRIDITNYRKSTAYYSQQNLLQKAGFTGYGQFFFSLDQLQIITRVQFPLITETLAQFLPIFNFLLALGFIAKAFSESRLIQDINNIYLKEYYKQTAIKLISDKKKDEIYNQPQLTQAEYIQQLHTAINDTNYFQKSKVKQQASFKIKNKNQKGNNQLESEKYKLILDQTKKKLNISEVYSDLIEIKTAIKLLMSPEQYAAMKFCGCDISLASENQEDQGKIGQQNIENIDKVYPFPLNSLPSKNLILQDGLNSQRMNPFEKKLNSKIISKQNEEGVCSNTKMEPSSKNQKNEQDFTDNSNNFSQKNHLEQIEEMLANKQILFQKLQCFIEKIQNKNKGLSQTDINIYSSLIGQNYQDLGSNQLVVSNINS